MNIYDKEQLLKDLQLIVSWYGERVQHGFYTRGVYHKGGITIVDRYVDEPVLCFNQKRMYLDEIDIGSSFGDLILRLAQNAGDAQDNLFKSWGCNVVSA